jgi:citrate lyase subunit beta/citryl-CoA lyase
MPMHPLRLCRSILFLPASNPRAIDKARTLDADMIILDCEDAVKPEDKPAARQAAVQAAEAGFGGRPVAIRTNGRATMWYGADVVAFRASRADYLILPKAEDAHHVHETSRLASKPILAMIETAAGVLNAPAIARETKALIAGTNDLGADLGLPPGAGREGLSHSLQMVVLAARAAGVAAFDGVHNKLEDEDGLARQCEEGRLFGFDGKSLIHPAQIETANRIFGPSEEQVEAAERLIMAASGGAERYEGRMIEAMHVDQARAVLAKARR